jgi:hypothetical protein
MVALGYELWETLGDLPPELAAQAESDEWPPRDI